MTVQLSCPNKYLHIWAIVGLWSSVDMLSRSWLCEEFPTKSVPFLTILRRKNEKKSELNDSNFRWWYLVLQRLHGKICRVGWTFPTIPSLRTHILCQLPQRGIRSIGWITMSILSSGNGWCRQRYWSRCLTSKLPITARYGSKSDSQPVQYVRRSKH